MLRLPTTTQEDGRRDLASPPGAATRAAVAYDVYALVFLVGTLASGVWLRSVFVWPGTLRGFDFSQLVHAHSHLAFFGWVTPALFALIVGAATLPARRVRLLGAHAHLLGAASALAFPGFLLMGYAPPTIALGTLHVALWAAFATLCWGALRRTPGMEARFYLAALLFLLLAGAGAMTPGVVQATGGSARAFQLALQLFLTPFTAGWLTLGAFGAVYGRLRGGRFSAAVLVLTLVGVLPSIAAHAPAAGGGVLWGVAGRAGMGLLGLASLLFAADVLRERGVPPLLRLGGAAALAKGAAEGAFALGLAAPLLGSRPLVIAYLHLLLLGMVTSALLGVLATPLRVPRLALLHAAGLVLMLGSLTVTGVPGGFEILRRFGGTGPEAFVGAWIGGVMSLLALGGVVVLRAYRDGRYATAEEAAGAEEEPGRGGAPEVSEAAAAAG